MRKLLNRIAPSLWRLYAYFLDYKVTLVVATVFMVLSASTSSLTATLLGQLTDIGFYGKEAWVIYGAPLALIGVTLLYAISSILSAYLMAKISQRVLKGIRMEMFDSMLHWPEGEYLKHPTGTISAKFVNEASLALGGAAQSVIVLVRDVVQAIALLGVLFWYNWQLTLVTCLVAPILVFVLRKVSKRVRRIVAENQNQVGQMVSRVQEAHESERLVKISQAYETENSQFDKINHRIRRLSLKTIQMQSIGTPLTQLLVMVAIAFVVGVALLEAQQGRLTFGDFITFLSAMLLIKAPIQHLAGLNATFAMVEAAAKSIFAVIDTECEKDTGTIELNNVKGDIVFENVTFQYPDTEKPVLQNFNLHISPGEKYTLRGESGAGKTTLVNLIPRFWDVTEGRILIDGIDIRDMTLSSLRKQIAMVSQEVFLFNRSIYANITYGADNPTEEALTEALDAARLKDLIGTMLEGLKQGVGESGQALSGGQKQRVGIARALLQKSSIVIFDEATSALDAENEQTIQRAVEELIKGKTAISISHKEQLKSGFDAKEVVVK